MKINSVTDLPLPGVKLINFARFGDARGYFTETVRVSDLQKIPGMEGFKVGQINESVSTAGIFRGMHFQWNPHMAKLLRVLDGEILDLALCIDPNSLDFGKMTGEVLTASPGELTQTSIYIPAGYAHGFVALTDCRIEYICDTQWSPTCEVSINIFDPEIDSSTLKPEYRDHLTKIDKSLVNKKDIEGLTLEAWKNSDRAQEYANTI